MHRKPTTRPVTATTHKEPAMFEILWSSVLFPLLRYLASTLAKAATLAQPLIAFAILAYAIYFGLNLMRNGVLLGLTSSVRVALAPVCHLPYASHYLGATLCTSTEHDSQDSDQSSTFNELVHAQAAFEDVVDMSREADSLPRDMKHSEASIRDLRVVVEYSNLPSRHELVNEFGGFIETARQASWDLTRYNSRIGAAVDRILTTNQWTLKVLDGIQDTEAKRGSLSKIAQLINPLTPFTTTSLSSQRTVVDQYLKHTSALEDQVLTLINEAQALLEILNNLDNRLDLIASITQRDGIQVKSNQDDLFAHLWTKLGGNRKEVDKLKYQLSLLDNMGKYRRLALAHVSATMLKLQAIAANLEDLRARVAQPEILGIQGGQLEMHIREISLGVDRLETVRNEGRRIEGQRQRAVLDGPGRLALDA